MTMVFRNRFSTPFPVTYDRTLATDCHSIKGLVNPHFSAVFCNCATLQQKSETKEAARLTAPLMGAPVKLASQSQAPAVCQTAPRECYARAGGRGGACKKRGEGR